MQKNAGERFFFFFDLFYFQIPDTANSRSKPGHALEANKKLTKTAKFFEPKTGSKK